MVNWDFFSNKRAHEQVSTFNNTLRNNFSNHITKKFVTIDDKEPPWMTEETKNKTIQKNFTKLITLPNGKTTID